MADGFTHPTQIYSFTDFSINNPKAQQPGDRLDAQFASHATILNQIIVALNNDEAKVVTQDDLDPTLLDTLTAQITTTTGADVVTTQSAAYAAQTAATQATNSALTAESAAQRASDSAEVVQTGQGSVLAALQSLTTIATGQFITLQNAKADVDNSANDAAYAAALASDYAVAAQAWAENMPDIIPPNILAVMGVTGDHWSSRWWANQCAQFGQSAEDWANQAKASADAAAASLDEFTDLYLGPHANAPALDNDGNALQVGATYFNTSSNSMFVWTGTIWQVSSNAVGWVPEAPVDGQIYVRQNAIWIPSASGMSDAPNDGKAYARKSIGWAQLNAADVVFNTTTVAAALAATASQTDLNTEIAARQAGDSALSARLNNLKASNIPNDSGVAGNAISDALNTLNSGGAANASAIAANTAAINANTTNITANTNAIATKQDKTAGLTNFVGLTPAFQPGDVLYATGADTLARLPHGNVNESLTMGASNLPIWKLAAAPIAVTDNPPATALDSSLWWESDTGYLYLKYNDGNSSQWVQVNGIPSAVTAAYVQKTGDTMTGALNITKPYANPGDEALVIAPSAGSAYVVLTRAAGQSAAIEGKTGANLRWSMFLGNNAAEGGSNAGSDFALNRYSDAGALIDTPLSINRSNGSAFFGGAAYVYGGSFVIRQLGSASPTILQILDSSNNSKVQLYWNSTNGGVYFSNVAGGSNFNLTGANATAAPAAGGNFICSSGLGYQTGGGPWTALSDERIKTVQADYAPGLAEVLALHPVVYTFKGNDSFEETGDSMHKGAAEAQTPFVGLIAQEAELVLPGMVGKSAGWIDGEPVDDLRSLNNGELTYALVNAVKALNQQIVDLKAEIASLKGTP